MISDLSFKGTGFIIFLFWNRFRIILIQKTTLVKKSYCSFLKPIF